MDGQCLWSPTFGWPGRLSVRLPLWDNVRQRIYLGPIHLKGTIHRHPTDSKTDLNSFTYPLMTILKDMDKNPEMKVHEKNDKCQVFIRKIATSISEGVSYM